MKGYDIMSFKEKICIAVIIVVLGAVGFNLTIFSDGKYKSKTTFDEVYGRRSN